MTSRVEIARTAMRRAFELRRELGIEQDLPICPIDAADRRGVEVWFTDVGTMEGLYVRDTPARILLPADRPFGRQVFACAHELGHHELGHGTRLDEYLAEDMSGMSIQSEEQAANVFGGAFLMPRAAVDRAFRVRGWTVDGASAAQVYTVACSLGVSFEGFLTHLSEALRLLGRERAQELAKTSLPKLRESFVGTSCNPRLVIADLQWTGIAIDLAVGDSALLPKGTGIDGVSVRRVQSISSGEWFQADRPGLCRATHASGWSAFVRVRRKLFVGLGAIRHLDDPDVE